MDIQGYNIPEDLYYDQDHYWYKKDGDLLIMGMNDFAQKLAGDIVYVQLPFEGKALKAGKKFAKVESGKWVGKVFSPFNGELVESNQELESNPRLINQDCYGQGWMYKIKPEDLGEMEKLFHGPENLEKWLLAEIEKHSAS